MLQTSNREVVSDDTGAVMAGKAYPVQGENQQVGGGDPETEALSYRDSSIETYDQNAFIDPTLQRDIDSIKLHTRRSAATCIAVRSGDFSDPLTWWNVSAGGQAVPGAGARILVPRGINVRYDAESATQYEQLRVDGGWIWADDRNVEMHVDTIFVDHTGTYQLATEGTPAPETFTQKVVFTDTGPLDVSSDPVKMQRGLVCFGQASIYATPVIGITRATAGLVQGATSVTLDRQVMGVPGFRDWKVGDELIIPGTRMRGYCNTWENWEYEVVTITSIDNSAPSAPVIHFAGDPLVYPHPACYRKAALTPHVVNRTRNFQTWTDGVPSDPQRRAHQLFKNKDQNTVEYVEAWGMGRTDMDFKKPGHTITKLMSMPTLAADTNTNGRYTWHFHRNGAKDPTLNPSVFRGCVGSDSPSWVFVHHDSHGEMHECIAFDFQAVGFAGEGGGSWGEISGCIAIGTRQGDNTPSTNHIKNGGQALGTIGHGFWSNSRPLNFKNCVAADCGLGYGWTSRISFGTSVYPGITRELRAWYGLAQLPDTVAAKTFAVIEGFENNEAYACNWGGSIAKKFPVQHHDLVSKLDGFTAWEVDKGFHWQYTGMYSMLDFEIIGFDPANRTQTPYTPDKGLEPFRQTVGMNFIRPRIIGFKRGISFSTVGGDNTLENKQHKVVDPIFTDVDDSYTNGNVPVTLPWSAGLSGFIDVEEIALASVGDSSAGAIIPGYTEDSCTWSGSNPSDKNHFVIAHDFALTDSLGTHTRQRGLPNAEFGWGLFVNGQNEANTMAEISKDGGIITLINETKMQLLMVQEGVWTSAAGDKVLLIPDVAEDRFSGEPTYFYTPVALRMSAGEYANIAPNENGPLGVHGGQDFTSFNPAGTPGLT